jgi:hypothetical protein
MIRAKAMGIEPEVVNALSAEQLSTNAGWRPQPKGDDPRPQQRG